MPMTGPEKTPKNFIDFLRDLYSDLQPGEAVEIRTLLKGERKTIINSWWITKETFEDEKEASKFLTFVSLQSLQKYNIYMSISIHSLQKLEEKCLKQNKKWPNVKGTNDTAQSLKILPIDIDLEIENVVSHADHKIYDKEKVKELCKEICEKIVKNSPIRPRYVIYTGGGLQILFVAPPGKRYSTNLLRRFKNVVSDYIKRISSDLKLDVDTSIYAPGKLIRLPYTINWNYTDPDGKILKIRGEILYKGEEYQDLEEVIKTLKKPEMVPKYKVKNKEALAHNLKMELEQVWEDLMNWKRTHPDLSRQHVSVAIVGFLARNLNMPPKDLEEVWEQVIDYLISKGLEDPRDKGQRISIVEQTFRKLEEGKPIATRKYLVDHFTNVFQRELPPDEIEKRVDEIFGHVKRAISPFRVGVKRIGRAPRKPPYRKSRAPQTWSEVREEDKKEIYKHYLLECAKHLDKYILFSYLRIPSEFEYVDRQRIVVNVPLYRSFLDMLAKKVKERIQIEIDKDLWERPLPRDVLIEIFKDLGGFTDEDLRSFIYTGLLEAITPVGMRLPECVEYALRELFNKGDISDEDLELFERMVLYIKYFSPMPYLPRMEMRKDEDETGISERYKEKLIKWILDLTVDSEERKEELLTLARKILYESEKLFPCDNPSRRFVEEKCPVVQKIGGPTIKCPFVFPEKVEGLLRLVRDVQFHGTDGIMVLVGGGEKGEPRILVRRGERNKAIKEIIEEIGHMAGRPDLLRELEKEIELGDGGRLYKTWMDMVIDHFHQRGREVKSTLGISQEIIDRVIDFLRRENKVGILPYKNSDGEVIAKADHLFLRDGWVEAPSRLVEVELLKDLEDYGIRSLKSLTATLQELLGPNFKKIRGSGRPLVLFEDENVRRQTPSYAFKLDWFRRYVGEPNIKKDVETLKEMKGLAEEGEENEN